MFQTIFVQDAEDTAAAMVLHSFETYNSETHILHFMGAKIAITLRCAKFFDLRIATDTLIYRIAVKIRYLTTFVKGNYIPFDLVVNS